MSQIPSNPILPGDGTPVEPGGGDAPGAPPPHERRLANASDDSIDWKTRALEAEGKLALATQELEALRTRLSEHDKLAPSEQTHGSGAAGNPAGVGGVNEVGGSLGACMPIASAPSAHEILGDALDAARTSGTRTSILRYLRLRRGV